MSPNNNRIVAKALHVAQSALENERRFVQLHGSEDDASLNHDALFHVAKCLSGEIYEELTGPCAFESGHQDSQVKDALNQRDKFAGDCIDMEKEISSLCRALRKAGDEFQRIQNTPWGYDGDCGVVGIASNAIDVIDQALATPVPNGLMGRMVEALKLGSKLRGYTNVENFSERVRRMSVSILEELGEEIEE